MVDIFALQMIKKQSMSMGEMPIGKVAAILSFFGQALVYGYTGRFQD